MAIEDDILSNNAWNSVGNNNRSLPQRDQKGKQDDLCVGILLRILEERRSKRPEEGVRCKAANRSAQLPGDRCARSCACDRYGWNDDAI